MFIRIGVTKSVIVWHNILTIALLDDVMFKLRWLSLYFLSLLFLLKNANSLKTLNVGINSPTTEDAYKGMTMPRPWIQTNCNIILVPIPSLLKPPFLTALISCKHSCRFSPLRNTVYPIRKLTIHFGNRPPIKRQGKLPLTQHSITPLLYKTQLSKQITFTEAWYAPPIHKSFHSHIFTSLKMSIPITKLLR